MKARINIPKKSYVISASLGRGCYRHIKISASATLNDLAEAILDSFDFANDHLHAFFLDNESWSDGDSYYLEPDRGQRDSTKYSLEKAGFQKDLKFIFLFDFGDEWKFNCKVLKELDEATQDAEVLRTVGFAPEQYPDDDEYYEDDDEDYDDDDEENDDYDNEEDNDKLALIDALFSHQKPIYTDNGYVIRLHNLHDGKTYYKGKKDYSKTKSGIGMRDTYTLKGAKIAISTMLTNSGNNDTTQYSIERLDECYPARIENDSQYDKDFKHAMKRLEELIDGNDFDNGDKMRINEVRRVLQYFIADLTDENKDKK